MSDKDRKVLSVTEITRRIKSLLEGQVGSVWVEGEVSNLRKPSSGHWYFTLKDTGSQISAVFFRGSQKPGQALKDGDMVRVYGRATVYERGGNYQILVRTLEEAGKGDLQRQFEELKERLKAEGLFEQDAKKELPLLPRHVGVVTSATGAAVKDILNVINRRFPNMHIVIVPVKVQGEGAANEIAKAIDLLNEHRGVEVMIVGRGGGSIEDLWAFNEEPVARAIWRSVIPVISAVGHEIDFTIADFVADLRAPTPSAAAELVVGRKVEFEERLEDISSSMARVLKHAVTGYESRYNAVAGSYVFREPGNLVRQYGERLNSIALTLKHELIGSTREVMQVLDDASQRLTSGAMLRCERAAASIERTEGALRVLNPKGVLKRGYSLTIGSDGKCLTSVKGVKKGEGLVTVLADGEVKSTIIDVSKT